MTNDSISKNIRYFRHEKGLTQQQLADKIGVSWEMVSRYERGESSPMSRIDELSTALDVNISTLLEDDPTTKKIAPDFFEVPYHNSLPEDLDFNESSTKDFYKAPVWMKSRDKGVFAISPSLLSNYPLKIDLSGPVFVSPEIRFKDNSLILVKEGSQLKIVGSEEITEDDTYIGIVIAQERRFV